MNYNRTAPSPRHLERQDLYRIMHGKGESFLGAPPEMTFPGGSLLPRIARIKHRIERTAARTVLDYGSGKGKQFIDERLTG